jgi:hypothetical protein
VEPYRNGRGVEFPNQEDWRWRERVFRFFRGDAIQLKGRVYSALQEPGRYVVGWYGPNGPTPPPPGFAPANITGFFAWYTLKYETPDPDANAVAQVTTGTGNIVFVVPTTGDFTITVPASVTAPLPDGEVRLLDDFQLQDLSANIETASRGVTVIRADVTRATNQNPPLPPPAYPAMPEGFITVPSTSAFGGLNVGALPDGTLAYVPGVGGASGTYYQLLSQSTATIDNQTVFQANPNGRWILLPFSTGSTVIVTSEMSPYTAVPNSSLLVDGCPSVFLSASSLGQTFELDDYGNLWGTTPTIVTPPIGWQLDDPNLLGSYLPVYTGSNLSAASARLSIAGGYCKWRSDGVSKLKARV